MKDDKGEDVPKPKPTTEDMCKSSAWVHYTQSILNQGKCRQPDVKEDEFPEGTDPEEMKRLTELRDPSEPKLKWIGKDQKVRGGLPPWLIKTFQLGEYTKSAKGEKICHGAVVVKSLWWPGAYSFFHRGRTSQIYCGDGQK